MSARAGERRLAAIVSLDVVGYSRLMRADEAGTFARLKAYRVEFAEPAVAARGGRVVKLMGDGMLVEFAGAVDALACAVAIQRGLAERNAATPNAQRIEVRVGINVGDVIVEGDDIFGDGVNVAAMAAMATSHVRDWSLGWSDSPEESLRRAHDTARQALALDPDSPEAQAILSFSLLWMRQHDRALIEAAKAAALGPNNSSARVFHSLVLSFCGRPDEAIPEAELCLRLDPKWPSSPHRALAHAHYVKGDYATARGALERAVAANPNFLCRLTSSLPPSMPNWACRRRPRSPRRSRSIRAQRRDRGRRTACPIATRPCSTV